MKVFQGFLLVSLLFLSGCAEKKFEVSGTVKYEGQPIAKGYISFIPEKGGQGGGGPITNGQYSISVPPGRCKVIINASKMTKLPEGETGMLGKTEEEREYIPTRYNAESKLTADVAGNMTLDFNDLIPDPQY